MGEPGDRASKRQYLREPTQSDHADGHGGVPNNADLELPLPPGSKSSARPHTSHAREPGDLEGVGDPMVGRGHGGKATAAIRSSPSRSRTRALYHLQEVGELAGNARGVDGGKARDQRGNSLHETRSGLRTGKARSRPWSGSDSERRKGKGNDSATCLVISRCRY